jgi:hypothetical protein
VDFDTHTLVMAEVAAGRTAPIARLGAKTAVTATPTPRPIQKSLFICNLPLDYLTSGRYLHNPAVGRMKRPQAPNPSDDADSEEVSGKAPDCLDQSTAGTFGSAQQCVVLRCWREGGDGHDDEWRSCPS